MRQLRGISILAAAILATALLVKVQSRQEKVVTANAFRLIDPKGEIAGEFSARAAAGGVPTILLTQGGYDLHLQAHHEGTSILATGPNGKSFHVSLSKEQVFISTNSDKGAPIGSVPFILLHVTSDSATLNGKLIE